VAGPLTDFPQSPITMAGDIGPCVRSDDQQLESIAKLGHWPTWQIISEENRAFTKE
jgi:hypothetical protein